MTDEWKSATVPEIANCLRKSVCDMLRTEKADHSKRNGDNKALVISSLCAVLNFKNEHPLNKLSAKVRNSISNKLTKTSCMEQQF